MIWTGEGCGIGFCCCLPLNLPGDKESCYPCEGQRARHWPRGDEQRRTHWVENHSDQVCSIDSNVPWANPGTQNIKDDRSRGLYHKSLCRGISVVWWLSHSPNTNPFVFRILQSVLLGRSRLAPIINSSFTV